MDLEKRAKRQSLRVIISEIIMVLTVVVTVIVLALLVSGYWLNSNFEVERQGMLQINSVPTGATVSVDGDAPWFQRTNTSKILSSGEHVVSITKEGYDSWTKTVNISEGLLYRLNYPYLFLKERKKESVYDATTTTFATISPDRKLLLLVNNTTLWTVINLDNDTLKPITIDISSIISVQPTSQTPALFSGKILSAKWDSANSHILLKIAASTGTEWVLLDVKNPTKSVNLTREFAADFTDIAIFDHSASNLLAIRNGNLHKINVDARQISAVLVEGITDYDFYDSEIVYLANEKVGILKSNGDTILPPEELSFESAKILTAKFYDNRYVFIISENKITVYSRDNFDEIADFQITFSPENVKVGHDGEFVTMNSGTGFATLDMESMQMREWTIDSDKYGWVNNYMMYSVVDGKLAVYDFDGLNYRKLSESVSDRFPVTITNNKWLYYFSDDQLIREWLIAQ